jgi:hypothetical protein
MPENGLVHVVLVVAIASVAGEIEIGTALAVAVMTDVATAASPKVSSMAAVTVVATLPPGVT